ncbi:MAG TPA: DUF2252 domain-containing protein [Acidimicrobiales bacterium]|nr:DUF2252 domain-containing protein [Acidimicrobiales bacterium]
MATTVPTKNVGRPRGTTDGKAAHVNKATSKAFTPQVSEVGGMKVDRSLEKRVDHISSAEAGRQGKTARVAVPRTLHASWAAPAGRRSPVDIIAEQATTREPDLVPIRHGRMMVSPFTFYRGAAAIMAADLAATPSSGFRVQCCGDAHLLNFGGFTSPERSMLFDVNDFDETLPGPWEWDVKRLAASIEVAGRDGQLKAPDRRNAVEATVRQYREAMREFAALTELGVWYAHLDGESLVALVRAEVGTKEAPNLEATLAKARSKDSMKAFTKLTRLLDGQPIISADPPLIVPLRDLIEPEVLPRFQDELHKLFRAYRRTLQPDRRHLLEQYRIVDMARKVVGVGSVGTRCFVLLLMGRRDADPIFLQVKEAQDSVLAPFCGKSKISNQGQRVVEGQRLMQAASDITLGWLRTVGLDGRQRDFYIRQLWDGKVGVEPSTLTPATLAVYGRICGWTLARAHARSGDRIAISSYLGASPTFDTAMCNFAVAYADQNERDYDVFLKAVKSGVLQAETGV